MQIDTDEDYAKFFYPHFFHIIQRTRDEIELQMADENLKLKAMSLQLKNFDIENSVKHESLEKRYKGSIQELESQKRRFLDQIEQVRDYFHPMVAFDSWMMSRISIYQQFDQMKNRLKGNKNFISRI